MKLARGLVDGELRSGAVVSGDTAFALLPPALGTVDDLVRAGPSAREAVAGTLATATKVPLDQVRLVSPVGRFNRDILCTGWNYVDHFEESLGKREGQDPLALPEHPTFFTKGPDTVIGPEAEIGFDAELSRQWDYEAEVALVIGREGRSIREECAWEYVFGLCVANDVSQRDLQRAHGGQWLKGKSIDATMPLGPWITTTDEVSDPYSLRIVCELNGTRVQDASTAHVAFRFERLIAELSLGMTVRPGDIVLTGTPSGIGNARNPPVFLRDGDEVVTTVSELGQLRNRVVAARLV